jgi:adenine-specific DNA-methyltransferase
LARAQLSESIGVGLSLLTGDAFQCLDQVTDESIQLVVTSPPYNVGKEYERDKTMSLEEYLAWLQPIINKLCTKIRSSGSICWQVGNFVRDGEVFPLDYFFYKMFIDQGFKLRNRIIWQFNFGLHASKRMSGRYETLLWFTKTDDYTFNLDPIRIPQLYPGKRHAQRKGEKAGTPSGNPLGKNPSDVWTFSGDEFFKNNPVWKIPNVKSNHPEKTAHPCQFPHELVERCVLAFSNMGDTVLDPFVGTGTTAIAAIKAGRNAIGIDKSPDYIAIAQSRTDALREGNLKLRKSGLAVRKPNIRDSVARVPDEWLQATE